MSFAKSKYLNTWKQVDMKITDQGGFENYCQVTEKSKLSVNRSSQIFINLFSMNRSISGSFPKLSQNQTLRWIDYFSDFPSNYRKIRLFDESLIFKPNKANEAADNARYLRSLEPACKPLYAYDPLSMIEHIPNLIKVISNIYQGLCFDRPLY